MLEQDERHGAESLPRRSRARTLVTATQKRRSSRKRVADAVGSSAKSVIAPLGRSAGRSPLLNYVTRSRSINCRPCSRSYLERGDRSVGERLRWGRKDASLASEAGK
jgi:hypothetical protein